MFSSMFTSWMNKHIQICIHTQIYIRSSVASEMMVCVYIYAYMHIYTNMFPSMFIPWQVIKDGTLCF